MQVVGHVAVVSESIRNAALELRYLWLYLLLLLQHPVFISLDSLDCLLLITFRKIYALQVWPGIIWLLEITQYLLFTSDLALEKFINFGQVDYHLILVTRFQHFPQLLDLLLHSLGFLHHTLDTPYVGLEVLVHVKFLVELELLKRLLKFACFFIERDSIWVEYKDVRRILHPSFKV